MNDSRGEASSFAEFVEVLRPVLPMVVIIGGWAHRLYRFHPASIPQVELPLMTFDVDVAVDTTLRDKSVRIGATLIAGGFEPERTGDASPPVTRYRANRDSGFYVEFLTPLHGDGRTRKGEPDVTAEIAGVSAQKLRYLDVLLTKPWSVGIGPSDGFPLSQPAELRVPNPVSFITQKLLIHDLRKGPEERAKDIAYLFDTIELFGNGLVEFKSIWQEGLAPTLPKKTRKRVQQLAKQLCGDLSDDIRAAAVEIGRAGRSAEPATIMSACRDGLRVVFE